MDSNRLTISGAVGRQLVQAYFISLGIFGYCIPVQTIVKTTQEFGGKHQEYGFELFPVPCLLGHLYTEVLADKGAITFMQPGGFPLSSMTISPEYM